MHRGRKRKSEGKREKNESQLAESLHFFFFFPPFFFAPAFFFLPPRRLRPKPLFERNP